MRPSLKAVLVVAMTTGLDSCVVVPAYPPPVVVGPPVVRVYPATPPAVVYRPYYGYRRHHW